MLLPAFAFASRMGGALLVSGVDAACALAALFVSSFRGRFLRRRDASGAARQRERLLDRPGSAGVHEARRHQAMLLEVGICLAEPLNLCPDLRDQCFLMRAVLGGLPIVVREPLPLLLLKPWNAPDADRLEHAVHNRGALLGRQVAGVAPNQRRDPADRIFAQKLIGTMHAPDDFAAAQPVLVTPRRVDPRSLQRFISQQALFARPRRIGFRIASAGLLRVESRLQFLAERLLGLGLGRPPRKCSLSRSYKRSGSRAASASTMAS
jgi:hypothetical protein